MMPRIPLPLKLLLSYLCIVTIGAGPTFVYVRAKLQTDLLAEAATKLVARGRRIAQVIGTAPPSVRLSQLQLLGQASVDRLTFLSPRGELLFDNESVDNLKLENHIGRPEVRFALGETSVEPVDFAALVHDAAGVGIARRVSETTGIDTLYVAQRVTAANGELVGILRMAMPVERIHTMTNGTMHFARNAQALAVSLAIGFSLLAAILFVRPLQRVSKMVHALAAGDIGAQVGPLGNDEVGDVGRSLEQMALELRRKLLTAGLGEALLSQLVEALATPCMVFEESGTIVAMNGAARRHLRIDGQAAGQRMKEFTEHEAVCAALRTAEYEGEPEPLQVLLPWSVEARGHMHVLKRPGMGPLRVFIGSEPAPEPRMLLPDPTEIQPRTLGPMLEAAATQARGALVSAGVTVQLPGAPPSVLVIDASGRLMGAVATALAGCARGLEGRRETLAVGIVEEPLRIRLELNAVASPETVLEVRKHLEPFGGAIEVLSAETHLWLPRA